MSMEKYKITGSLIEAYIFCKRQAWLIIHQITGDQYNEFLSIGRLISEESYNRNKKEILIDGNKIDIIKSDSNVFTIIETKKSSRMLDASKAQLFNYLYFLSKKGYSVKGEIRVPEEKKVIPIRFGKEEKEFIEKLHKEISQLVNKEKPPLPEWRRACKNCSYNEFCWS